MKSEIATLQALGRALRRHDSKEVVYIYDFMDKEKWESLVDWIDKTGKMDGKDLNFAKSIVKAIDKNGAPTLPQIKIANRILNHAREKGFTG